MRWPRPAHMLVLLGSVGAFLVGGSIAAGYLIDSQRAQQLEEVGLIALRRAENAVEYGISTLRELAAGGNLGCDGGALQAVRLQLYQRGAVKDIRLTRPDATVLCSAFSETLEFDKGWVTRGDMLPTADGAYLFRVEQLFGTALGAMIDVSEDLGVIGILGINGAALDVLPAELRERSEIGLELADGRMITHTRLPGDIPVEGSLFSLSVDSSVYPLRVVVNVEEAALAGWHREPYLPIMVLSGFLGAIFGLLLMRALLRPKTALEELDTALVRGEIRPYFQPIFELGTGNIFGAEVLARWVKPDGTVVPPARFIELAEESGRIRQITWHLLRISLAELHSVLVRDPEFKLSVNISPCHFVSNGFIADLQRILQEAGVATRQVTLELTERESFEDPAHAAAVVAEVRALGFKVAIDDVGIGHSGLSQIQNLRADILKIDKFFVDSVNRDESAVIMIGMLVRLAEEMKMSIVAEGIEAHEQVEALIECGVGSGQGYVVSPPVPAKSFLELMAARSARTPRAGQKATRAA